MRFGFSDDEEGDVAMDDATPVHHLVEVNGQEIGNGNREGKEDELEIDEPELYHSLPAHLGLDPVKMKEMRMLMFPSGEDDELDDYDGNIRQKLSNGKEHIRRPLHNPPVQKVSNGSGFAAARKMPLALLEYNPASFDSSAPGAILMAQKGLSLKRTRAEGFKLDLNQDTPVSGSHSRNVVDAGLFMGRSFRVGWGPNGVLVHCGAPVGSDDSQRVLSSVISVEKVAIDKVIRDENNKEIKELTEFSFDLPLNFHKELRHEIKQIDVGPFKLQLQKVVSTPEMLLEICRGYIDIIERKLEVTELSSSTRLVLMHQIIVWELIKVLFYERVNTGQSKAGGADNEEDIMQDTKENSLDVDQEALPLIRRAEFSCWLQESVCHRVQGDVSSLDELNYLDHIFLLLTGRQLDAAVEMATARGDVRLACLLSQAGGSMVNRADILQQLHLWRVNGLDFNFIERERIRLYELLSGNINNVVHDIKIDWKRFLGLLMWYRLAPDTPLPIIFKTYQEHLDNDKAPYPLPIYIDEGPAEDALNLKNEHFDLSYYLMLLHANGVEKFGHLKSMFSAFSSTNDPLDFHMTWHQRAVLESIGLITSYDLQVLDMGLISQLLCIGQCHWAIYVALHIPYRDDYPYLQASIIREILFQYCESWSSDELQRRFIEDLGIPLEWLHEAMAVHFNYYGDHLKSLEHFLECQNWQKAHTIFTTTVAHTLFLSGNHSEIWGLATSMEDHKSEIENWDLGAGIYITFYLLRSSLQEDSSTTMTELDSLESKNSACQEFLSNLKKSLAVLSDRLPIDARVAYSKMAEEINGLLLCNMSGGSSRDIQLSCFETVLSGPTPEDVRSTHLQDAVSLFTCYLAEMTA